VLGNDSDIDGDSLAVVVVTGPSHGTLSLNADGSFAYTPNANFNGDDAFIYRASDGSLESDAVTVNITVNPVNDAPVAAGDAYSTDEDTALNVGTPGVLGNDSDVDGDALTAVLVAGPSHGTLTLNADGSFIYAPNANFNGSDAFTYKASDGSLESDAATVSITVRSVNDAPVASADEYSTDEDLVLNVAAPGVLGNDSDIDGDSLAVVVVTGPSHGTLTLNGDGSFAYTPAANYYGEDSFSYMANDGTADSDAATVSITVSPVNDPPTLDPIPNPVPIVEDAGEQVVALSGITAGGGENQALGVTALSSDPGLIPDPTVVYTSPNSTGSLRYTPLPGMSGSGDITVTVRDAGLDGTLGNDDDKTETRGFTVEVLRDADGDGIPDVDDPDDDNDGMEDWWELLYGLDPEGDDAAEDLDRDGLSNLEEYLRGINPLKADSDGDGIGDGTEVSAGTDPQSPDETPVTSLKTARLRVTDVTTGAFSVVWVANQEASCFVNVYSDAGGESLVRGLTIVDESANHFPAARNGVMKVDVTGVEENTVYYFQIVTVNSEGMLIEPTEGDLPSVKTELTGQTIFNDVLAHRILMSDGITPALGALLVAEVEGANYPVTGWVGEWFTAPWVLVDLSNLFDENHTNLELAGGEAIVLESLGGLMGFRRLSGTVPPENGEIQTLIPEPNDDECTLDDSGPDIDQLSPGADGYVNLNMPSIGALYVDQSEIVLSSARLEFDGADVTAWATVGSSGIQYTPSSPLSEGLHSVILSISDEWGYKTDLAWSFTVDETAPVVTITAPPNGAYLYPAEQTVAWSVFETNNPLSGVTVFVNGTPTELGPDALNREITLDPGRNLLEVAAQDRAGNVGRDTVRVNLDVDTDGDGIGNSHDPDDDNDLMPDTWEIANGLDPLDPSDAMEDSDGDAISNLTEYLAGTLPGDDGSKPQETTLVKQHIMVTDVTPDGFSVIWQSTVPATCSLVVYDGTGMPLSGIDIISESDSHPPAEDRGVMKVTVNGLQPETLYRVRTLTVAKEGGEIGIAPLDPDFLEVETEIVTAAVRNYVISQRIYDENETPAEGALLVASVEGGRYPVTAWAGQEGRAQADLNEVYSESFSNKLQLVGGEELTLWSFGGLLGNYVNVQKAPDPNNGGDGVEAIPAASFLSRDEGVYLDLKWDLNIVGIPVHSSPALTSYDLLRYLSDQGGGGSGVVEMIQRYNSKSGTWEYTSWLEGNPSGADFPIKAGEAYVIYMGRDLSNVWFEGPACGAAAHLSEGLNLITLPSAPEDYAYRSYDILQDLGDPTQVSSARRYDSIWGWQTTSWFRGFVSGVNFTARNGEGYLIYMRQEKENWRPY
jgi:VCBS repeat-containing protein